MIDAAWQPEPQTRKPVFRAPLYLAATIAAFCGIAYELLLASYATFLLGASIFQYSLVISLMMASMGLGSLFTNRFESQPLKALLIIEITLACLAAIALPLLYFTFSKDLFCYPVLLMFVILIGGGLGMEIPLLNMKSGSMEGLPRILFFDYLGGFIGGILFPIILVPQLGFFKIAAILSLLNAVTGFVLLLFYGKTLGKQFWWFFIPTLIVLAIAITDIHFADVVRVFMEKALFSIQQ